MKKTPVMMLPPCEHCGFAANSVSLSPLAAAVASVECENCQRPIHLSSEEMAKALARFYEEQEGVATETGR